MFNNTLIFYNLINPDNIFSFCALAGSGMFVIQFLLNFIDVRKNEDFEDRSFIRMSVQAVTGFLMIFGWTAISFQREEYFQDGSTLVIAFVSGLFALFITSAIFRVAKKLQRRGS